MLSLSAFQCCMQKNIEKLGMDLGTRLSVHWFISKCLSIDAEMKEID